MSSFQDYVSQWKEITQRMSNNISDTIIPYEYMELLKRYKETVDKAKDALMKDDTIINKEKEWADQGLDCYDILILPYIEYGISSGIDQHVIMSIFQNKEVTTNEKKMNEYLQKIYQENPDNIESLINDLVNATINPDIKPSYLLDEFDQLFNELDQIGID